jgi:hypothetical protein
VVALTGIQGMEKVVRQSGGGEEGLLIGGRQFVPLGADLFADSAGDGVAGFWKTPGGKAIYLYEGGMNAYHRIRWYEGVTLHRVTIFCLALILPGSFVVGGVGWIRERRGRTADVPGPHFAVLATRVCSLVVGGLFTVFIFGMLGMTCMGVYKMVEEIRWPLLTLLALPLVAGVSWVGLLGALTISWPDPLLTRNEKMHHLAIVLTSLLAFGVLHYWNLLGFRF